MKTVIFRAPVLTQSGYGVHARSIARWLLSRNDINVKFHAVPWGDTPWLIGEQLHNGLIGEIIKRSVDHKERGDVSFQLQLPNEWDTKLARHNIGLTAGVEADKCNPEWIGACNQMSAVVFPSTFTQKVFTNTGNLTSPSYVIPEPYSDAILSAKQSNFNFGTPFNFLVFGQITGTNPHNDRKNTFFTLKWLCEAFKDDKDVGIVIKTNMGRNTLIDKMSTKNLLTSVLNEVRRGPYPKVHLVHGDMSDDEVASLYIDPTIKALVAATRGEGFGLPILEAAASKLPVIATNWSGHMDFMSLGKFVEVYYQLGEVHQTRLDNKIFLKGMKWANPSEEDFKRKVLKFRSSPNVPKEWATNLSAKIIENFSSNVINKKYDEHFGTFLL